MKMIRIILVFLCFGLYHLIIGQQYFNERFGFGFDHVPDGALNLLEVDDGYIINGGTGDSINPFWNRIGVLKINDYGEIQWKKTWGDSISEWYYAARGSLLQHFNAHYTVGSNNTYTTDGTKVEILLMKYNNNFDTLWSVKYSEKTKPYDTAFIARSLIGTNNGFVIVGLKKPLGLPSWAHLIKTDSLGNLIWEQSYGNDTVYVQGFSVIQTSDNGYAIGAYKWIIGHWGIPIGDPVVIKTDSLGNLEWEKNLGSQYQDGAAAVCRSGDGNIIVAARYDTDSLHESLYKSRIQLSKLGNNGNIIWNKLYGKPSMYTNLSNCRIDDLGNFILCGQHGDYPPPNPNEMGFLLKVNNEGDSLWYRQYAVLNGSGSYNNLSDAIPASDGGIIACGGCFPVNPDTGNQDAWVIKVDSMGCTSPWDCWVGEEELEVADNPNTIHIYPNPATNKFTVQSEKFEVEGCQLQVFDLFGRKVEEVEIPEGKSEIKVFTQGWQKGLYVVRVVAKNRLVGRGKVLVE